MFFGFIGFSLFLFIILQFIHPILSQDGCLGPSKNEDCPHYVGTFTQSLPHPNYSISVSGQWNRTDFGLEFLVPHCKGCNMMISLGKAVSWDDFPRLDGLDERYIISTAGYKFIQDGKKKWNELWPKDHNFCGQDSRQSDTENALQSSENIVAPCYKNIVTRTWTLQEMREEKFPNSTEKVFKEIRGADFVEYVADFYISVIYPFNVNDVDEKYSSRIQKISWRNQFPLQTKLSTDKHLFQKKEILVQTTTTSPIMLEALIELSPQLDGLGIDECFIPPESNDFGMEVRSLEKVDSAYQLDLHSTKEMKLYQGEIFVECDVSRCSSNKCHQMDRERFSLEVSQSSPARMMTTTRFNPTIGIFLGTTASPFQELYTLPREDTETITFAFGSQKGVENVFALVLDSLVLCQGDCTEGDQRWEPIVNGEIVTSDIHSVAVPEPIYPTHSIAFSLDYDILRRSTSNYWTFQARLKWIPKSRSSSSNWETSHIMKRIQVHQEKEKPKKRSLPSFHPAMIVIPIVLVAICIFLTISLFAIVCCTRKLVSFKPPTSELSE